MQINFNGTPTEAPEGQTLADFLAERGIQAEGTACAVNEEIVPKQEWSAFALSQGQQVDVFTLVAGG